MNYTYNSLPDDVRNYLESRFETYGLNPQLAYDHLLPFEVKIQDPDVIEEFMHNKHISHIFPTSEFPHMAGDLNNVFLEDPYSNLVRSNNIASTNEIFHARIDNSIDAFDKDFNDNGIPDRFENHFGT